MSIQKILTCSKLIHLKEQWYLDAISVILSHLPRWSWMIQFTAPWVAMGHCSLLEKRDSPLLDKRTDHPTCERVSYSICGFVPYERNLFAGFPTQANSDTVSPVARDANKVIWFARRQQILVHRNLYPYIIKTFICNSVFMKCTTQTKEHSKSCSYTVKMLIELKKKRKSF